MPRLDGALDRTAGASEVPMKLILDSSSLLGCSRTASWLDDHEVAVPIAVIWELAAQLGSDDPRRVGAARAALRLVADREAVNIAPEPFDAYRAAFGDPMLHWPNGNEFWRGFCQKAGAGECWITMLESWNAASNRGLTERSAAEYMALKQGSAEFQSAYSTELEQGMAENPIESDELGLGNPALTVSWVDGAGVERTLPECMMLLMVAGLVNQGGVAERLDLAVQALAADDDIPVFMLARETASAYRGGLDLLVRLACQADLSYHRSQFVPDRNDFFDIEITACVDDAESTVFVTRERKWRVAAERAGMAHRVVHDGSL